MQQADDEDMRILKRTMAGILARFEESGMTLDELGLKMGYPPDTARKSAWQFIRKTQDPRLSMLQRFARAFGIKVTTLLKE